MKFLYMFHHWQFSPSAGMKVRIFKRNDGAMVTVSRKRRDQLHKERRIVETEAEFKGEIK